MLSSLFWGTSDRLVPMFNYILYLSCSPIVPLPSYYFCTYVEGILQRHSTFLSTIFTMCIKTACDAYVPILLCCVCIMNPLWLGNTACAVYVQSCCVILLHWSIVFGNHWLCWAVTVHFFFSACTINMVALGVSRPTTGNPSLWKPVIIRGTFFVCRTLEETTLGMVLTACSLAFF